MKHGPTFPGERRTKDRRKMVRVRAIDRRKLSEAALDKDLNKLFGNKMKAIRWNFIS